MHFRQWKRTMLHLMRSAWCMRRRRSLRKLVRILAVRKGASLSPHSAQVPRRDALTRLFLLVHCHAVAPGSRENFRCLPWLSST